MKYTKQRIGDTRSWILANAQGYPVLIDNGFLVGNSRELDLKLAELAGSDPVPIAHTNSDSTFIYLPISNYYIRFERVSSSPLFIHTRVGSLPDDARPMSHNEVLRIAVHKEFASANLINEDKSLEVSALLSCMLEVPYYNEAGLVQIFEGFETRQLLSSGRKSLFIHGHEVVNVLKLSFNIYGQAIHQELPITILAEMPTETDETTASDTELEFFACKSFVTTLGTYSIPYGTHTDTTATLE